MRRGLGPAWYFALCGLVEVEAPRFSPPEDRTLHAVGRTAEQKKFAGRAMAMLERGENGT